MRQDVTATAPDGHRFKVYRVDPVGPPRAVVVVLHELLGLNPQIRRNAERFAALGYLALAPSLYDRIGPDIFFGYSDEEINRGRAIRDQVTHATMLIDLQATIRIGQASGRVATVGYCLGGSLAFLSTTRLEGVACAVGYYGNLITRTCEETPKAPCMLHYGERDVLIPPPDVEKVRAMRPDVEVFVYPADHGFDCDDRYSYDAAASKLALERTLGFLYRHLG